VFFNSNDFTARVGRLYEWPICDLNRVYFFRQIFVICTFISFSKWVLSFHLLSVLCLQVGQKQQRNTK